LRLLLIVNASASSVTARARVVIQKSLSADHELSVAETSRQGHATRLAQSAAARGTDAVVVLGGDGTLNEAANGLAGTDCALGVLPGGSTNVFARTIGMTNDPIEATGELLSALAAGPGAFRPVGLGRAGDRRFLFHVGVGFDAAVVSQVERRSTVKRYLGHAFFAYTALAAWARYDRRHPQFDLLVTRRDGSETRIDGGFFAIVMNTNPYTFLGERPFNLAPGTTLDTPLAVVVLQTLGAPTVLALAAAALRTSAEAGRPPAAPRRARIVTDVVSATLVGRRRVPYQMDGEPLGDVDGLAFAWEPGSLRLVAPAPRNPAGQAEPTEFGPTKP